MANVIAMLSAMAGMGAHPVVIEALAQFAGETQMTLAQKRYLYGPLVIHSDTGGFAAGLPEWARPQVQAERTEIVFGEMSEDPKPWIVGPTEIMAVMYGAALAAPMQPEYANLYLWASCHAAARHRGTTFEEIAGIIGEVPTDDQVLEGRRGVYGLREVHRRITHDVRRRVVQHAVNIVAASKPKPTPPAIAVAQMDLFGSAA